MTKELNDSIKKLNDSMKPYRLRAVENINTHFKKKKGMNLLKSIDEILEKDEIIEACVIGEYQPNYLLKEENFDSKFKKIIQSQPLNKPLSWEEAKKYLNYYFDQGFGAECCNPIYVWTNKNILFTTEYDGAINIKKLPRNPVDIEPYWGGNYE